MVLLLVVYLHPNDFARVDWEPGATNASFVTKDNSQKIRKVTIAFSEATTHVGRDQSRVRESAGFGNEGAHVEKIDAMKLTEKLETLETSRLLDIRGDAVGF